MNCAPNHNVVPVVPVDAVVALDDESAAVCWVKWMTWSLSFPRDVLGNGWTRVVRCLVDEAGCCMVVELSG